MPRKNDDTKIWNPFTDVQKSHGIEVGDKVALRIPFSNHSMGKVGWVCAITRNKAFSLQVQEGEVEAAVMHKDGSVTLRPKAKEGSEPKLLLFKRKTAFEIAFNEKGHGHGSILLDRIDFKKVPDDIEIGTIYLR